MFFLVSPEDGAIFCCMLVLLQWLREHPLDHLLIPRCSTRKTPPPVQIDSTSAAERTTRYGQLALGKLSGLCRVGLFWVTQHHDRMSKRFL